MHSDRGPTLVIFIAIDYRAQIALRTQNLVFAWPGEGLTSAQEWEDQVRPRELTIVNSATISVE